MDRAVLKVFHPSNASFKSMLFHLPTETFLQLLESLCERSPDKWALLTLNISRQYVLFELSTRLIKIHFFFCLPFFYPSKFLPQQQLSASTRKTTWLWRVEAAGVLDEKTTPVTDIDINSSLVYFNINSNLSTLWALLHKLQKAGAPPPAAD